MIRINNLYKSFGHNVVIDGLSAELPDHGIVTVTGPSGKGKTTLLNILAGLLKADGGEIVNDAASISYAFQDARLFPWLSVKKNIEIVFPKDFENKEETAEAWLDLVGLSEFADYLPDKLSGGIATELCPKEALPRAS